MKWSLGAISNPRGCTEKQFSAEGATPLNCRGSPQVAWLQPPAASEPHSRFLLITRDAPCAPSTTHEDSAVTHGRPAATSPECARESARQAPGAAPGSDVAARAAGGITCVQFGALARPSRSAGGAAPNASSREETAAGALRRPGGATRGAKCRENDALMVKGVRSDGQREEGAASPGAAPTPVSSDHAVGRAASAGTEKGGVGGERGGGGGGDGVSGEEKSETPAAGTVQDDAAAWMVQENEAGILRCAALWAQVAPPPNMPFTGENLY